MFSERDVCFRVLEELEAQRRGTLGELYKWPPDRMNFRPAPGIWSAVEVLDHVVRGEAGIVDQLEIGLRNPHKLDGIERPGIVALDSALRSDRRFKVPPQAEDIHPDPHTTLPEIEARWEAAREKLRKMLEGYSRSEELEGVFQHPFAGWMTLAEVLDHFSAHLYHHELQLERLRVASDESLDETTRVQQG